MELFDTHFHYYGESTPVEFMSNVKLALGTPPQSDAGTVDRLHLLAVGGDYVESLRAREFAGVIPDTYYAAGVHPHQAENFLAQKEDFSIFFKEGKAPVAIGELGVDYYYANSPEKEQLEVFEEFLDLALVHDLPAIVHIRDQEDADKAYRDAYSLLEPFAARGGRFVVHCFAGTPAWAEKFLALGGYIGVTGMVTFRRAENIREAIRSVPDDRLLIETDSPYLAPVPHRGKENHPGFLVLIAAFAAQLRGMSAAEFAALTTANGKRLFLI
ncbi:MAG: TatD family hydrolase [Lentisphaeria bacterium]|nr:TatD family hydrolase [Lentisphaeria bacterium]